MSDTTLERKLRKQEKLCGTWIQLADGEYWCVSGLPLGKSFDSVLEKHDTFIEYNLRREEQESKKLAMLFKDYALAILQVNYSSLTSEIFNDLNLVTMQHVSYFISISQGQISMATVIGTPEEHNAREKKR